MKHTALVFPAFIIEMERGMERRQTRLEWKEASASAGESLLILFCILFGWLGGYYMLY